MDGDSESPAVDLIEPDGGRQQGINGRPFSATGAVVLVAAALLAVLAIRTGGEPGGTPRSSRPPIPATPAPIQPPDDVDRIGDGPLLDDSHGLVLAVGGNRRDIHLVDLDTGDIANLGRRGIPRLIDGDQLLVQDDWNRWKLVDLTDPDRTAGAATSDGLLSTGVVAAEAGGVWFRHPADGPSQVWSRVDTGSGSVVQQITMPAGIEVATGGDARPLAGPELVGSGDGGVYALTADGSYRLILDARLIAFDEDLLLVSTCDPRLRCTNRWIDRGSLEVLDIPAPESQLGAAVIRGGRTLLAETHTETGVVVKIFDIATGRAVATGSPGGLSRSWVSPDGRFVAAPGFDALLVIDVRRGRTVTIERLTIDPTVHLVWGRLDRGSEGAGARPRATSNRNPETNRAEVPGGRARRRGTMTGDGRHRGVHGCFSKPFSPMQHTSITRHGGSHRPSPVDGGAGSARPWSSPSPTTIGSTARSILRSACSTRARPSTSPGSPKAMPSPSVSTSGTGARLRPGPAITSPTTKANG